MVLGGVKERKDASNVPVEVSSDSAHTSGVYIQSSPEVSSVSKSHISVSSDDMVENALAQKRVEERAASVSAQPAGVGEHPSDTVSARSAVSGEHPCSDGNRDAMLVNSSSSGPASLSSAHSKGRKASLFKRIELLKMKIQLKELEDEHSSILEEEEEAAHEQVRSSSAGSSERGLGPSQTPLVSPSPGIIQDPYLAEARQSDGDDETAARGSGENLDATGRQDDAQEVDEDNFPAPSGEPPRVYSAGQSEGREGEHPMRQASASAPRTGIGPEIFQVTESTPDGKTTPSGYTIPQVTFKPSPEIMDARPTVSNPVVCMAEVRLEDGRSVPIFHMRDEDPDETAVDFCRMFNYKTEGNVDMLSKAIQRCIMQMLAERYPESDATQAAAAVAPTFVGVRKITHRLTQPNLAVIHAT